MMSDMKENQTQELSVVTPEPISMNTDTTTPVAPCILETRKVILNLKPPHKLRIIKRPIDYRSQMGQFGWATIGSIYVPYVFRKESTCYVAVRIVTQKLLPRFFNTFKQELFDLFVIPSFTITKMERRLYNEINFNHCNSFFGINGFQESEQLVYLDDVIKLHEFLSHLYNRIILNTKVLHNSYGYMTFDKKNNIVPYYRFSGEPCFPVLYFKGKEDFLSDKSAETPPFAESVLRVLMQLQNISTSNEAMRVITLSDLKLYYEQNTFTESWMQKENDYFISKDESEAAILTTKCSDRKYVKNKKPPVTTPMLLLTFDN